jgi:hypothetical protein
MQITIVQAEIETAIRKYIEEQINVRDGMRIDIDLSATRGADGFKAIIDIVPDTSKKAVQQQQQVQVQKPNDPKLPAPSQAKEQAQPPVDNAHVAEGAEKFPEAGTGSAEPSSTEPTNTGDAGEAGNASPAPTSDAGATDAAQQTASAAADTPAEAPKTRTLFTNMKRVSNS